MLERADAGPSEEDADGDFVLIAIVVVVALLVVAAPFAIRIAREYERG